MKIDKNENRTKPHSSQKRPVKLSFVWIYGLIILGLGLLFYFDTNYSPEQTSWLNFKNEMLLNHDVEKIQVINQERVEVFIKKESLGKEAYKTLNRNSILKENTGPHYFFTIGSLEFFEQQLKEAQVNFSDKEKISEVYLKRGNGWSIFFTWVFPVALIFLFWSFYNRAGSVGRTLGSSVFDFGKSGAKEYENGKKMPITFKDIAGYEEAKVEVMEIVEFLKHPETYTRLGAKIPKGLLLLGPPGTGKTHMAKAVAGEAGVPFFSLSGSQFVEMFVGVGAARVRDLFKRAKEKAPSIVFIDEIDSIGRVRGAAVSAQSNDERESTLNQLLAELDGFDATTNVIVIAATNRPDILDSALLRPGRFDRHIFLELPNKLEREAIFKVHLRPLVIDQTIDLHDLVSQTPGFSGADIANVCNEAALIAARNKKVAVGKEEFTAAIDRIIGGLEKKSKIILPSERKIIAYHEAGHALVSWLLKNVDPLVKVSIIPRGRSLGAAMYLPEERQFFTSSQLNDRLCAMLAGRAAEDLMFNEVSSGALDDLENATKQAYSMIAFFGLSNKVGNVSFHDSHQQYQAFQKPYSEATGQMIDSEVRELTSEAFDRAKKIILTHQNKLEMLAELLLKKEILFKEELETVLGKREELSTEKEII